MKPLATALAIVGCCASLAWCQIEHEKRGLEEHVFDATHPAPPCKDMRWWGCHDGFGK